MSIIYSKEQDGTLNVLVSGKVTRDAEVKQNNYGSKIRFTIAYGKKKYMDVEAWADNGVGALASRLEQGDIVSAAGTMRSWEYNGKTYTSVDADMIITLNAAEADAVQTSAPEPSSATFEELDDDNGENWDLPF